MGVSDATLTEANVAAVKKLVAITDSYPRVSAKRCAAGMLRRFAEGGFGFVVDTTTYCFVVVRAGLYIAFTLELKKNKLGYRGVL